MIKKLFDKGYEILQSNSRGRSESSIVIGQVGRTIKDDFYSIIESLGLQFKPGPVYTKIQKLKK